MSSLAWTGSRGSATGPTPSTSSSGASNSVVPAAKKSPGRRTLPSTAARSAVIMDMKPAGEMLMREANSMAREQPRPSWTPTYASIFPEGFEALGGELGVAHHVLNVLVPEIMLKGLTNLTTLDLSGTKVVNLEPLRGLTNLRLSAP